MQQLRDIEGKHAIGFLFEKYNKGDSHTTKPYHESREIVRHRHRWWCVKDELPVCRFTLIEYLTVFIML